MKFSFGLVPVFLFAGVALASDVRVVEEIVAKVNGEIITTSEIARSRRQLQEELERQGLTGPRLQTELDSRSKNVLRDRIDNLLLVQKAKELNVNVDADVTKRLADIQRTVKIADQDKFHDYIREQSGIPFEDFRQQLRDQLMTERIVRQEVGSRINIPRADVEKYYKEHQKEFIRDERVFLSQILVSTEGKDPKEIPALEKKAKDLVERARKGERFGELARDNSDDPNTAPAMGAAGSYTRDQLQPQIADVVFSHDRGYVSDPIRLPNGFLILHIDQRYKAGLATLEEVENEIMNRLYEPLFEPAMRDYLSKLREEAFLQIRDGYVDSGAAPGKDTRWMDPAQLKPQTVTKEEVALMVHRKRLLWMIPLPLSETGRKGKSISK